MGEGRTRGSGFVYVLTNPAFKENIRKIGYTGRNVGVATRAAQLRTTGVPLAFTVEEAYECSRMTAVERLTHELLAARRISNQREFFEVPRRVADRTIRAARAWTSWAALRKALEARRERARKRWQRLADTLLC